MKTAYRVIVWCVLGKQPSQSTGLHFIFKPVYVKWRMDHNFLKIAFSDERLDYAERRIQFSVVCNSIGFLRSQN